MSPKVVAERRTPPPLAWYGVSWAYSDPEPEPEPPPEPADPGAGRGDRRPAFGQRGLDQGGLPVPGVESALGKCPYIHLDLRPVSDLKICKIVEPKYGPMDTNAERALVERAAAYGRKCSLTQARPGFCIPMV